MKKTGVLNKDISEVIGAMGHMDTLVVADAGLPIPEGVRRIDVAVGKGIPAFLDVVRVIESELKVQRIIIAVETTRVSPHNQEGLEQIFVGIPIEKVTHDQLKELCKRAKAVIRTGEFTPYANVILESGVVF